MIQFDMKKYAELLENEVAEQIDRFYKLSAQGYGKFLVAENDIEIARTFFPIKQLERGMYELDTLALTEDILEAEKKFDFRGAEIMFLELKLKSIEAIHSMTG